MLQPLSDRMNDAALVSGVCAQLQGEGYAALSLQTPVGVNALGLAAVEAVAAWAHAAPPLPQGFADGARGSA